MTEPFRVDFGDGRSLGLLMQYGNTLMKFSCSAMILTLGARSLRRVSQTLEQDFFRGGDVMMSPPTLSRLLDQIRDFCHKMWPHCPTNVFMVERAGAAIRFSCVEEEICRSILSLLEQCHLITQDELNRRIGRYQSIWEEIRSKRDDENGGAVGPSASRNK